MTNCNGLRIYDANTRISQGRIPCKIMFVLFIYFVEENSFTVTRKSTINL